MSDNAFLGTGWSFPPEFSQNQTIKMVAGEQDINESLTILLSTNPGERVMTPEYGCGIKALVFSEINLGTITQIKAMIKNAILYFEPRIELEQIDIDTNDSLNGKLFITIDYTVIVTNSRSNLVYPFYIMEGTLVDL